MKWLIHRLLTLFRSERANAGTVPEIARHHAILRRADRLLLVADEYNRADKARRNHP